MDDSASPGDGLAAGEFSAWVVEMRGALRGERAAEVPCGTCTACCTAAQFVHIGPDETATLARIPSELLFPAPSLPRGHLVLGYDERGHCPMLVDGRCSIYADRPRACRTYDCRIFAAAEVEPADPGVAARVRRWRFRFSSDTGTATQRAVAASAQFLETNAALLPDDVAPSTPTQLAVLAFRLHDLFLADDAPDPDVVRAEAIKRGRARPMPAPAGRSSRRAGSAGSSTPPRATPPSRRGSTT
jgi:Fe-S-cluster containining protein